MTFFYPPKKLLNSLLCSFTSCILAQTAQASGDDWSWDVKAQSSYISQLKGSFQAAYSGTNSLMPKREQSYSFSTTAYVGLRIPLLGELYLNPEAIEGKPLSGLVGMGSFSNGEMQKVAGSTLKPYLPRLFLRRDWALSETKQDVEAAPNQLAGSQAVDLLRLTVGKFAITDIFDANSFSHDARSQFLTWASTAQGAYDFAADAKGYSVGAALEFKRADWALRVGRFMVPEQSNGEKLSWALGRFRGDQVEVEHRHEWQNLPGALRLLLWRNREVMGAFQDALNKFLPGNPQVGAVRQLQTKSGFGLHWEQAWSPALGSFLRFSRGDGRTESYSFEDVDRSRQIGLNIKGLAWSRHEDNIGLLAIANSLSASHRQYLTQGGLTFFLGDGRLTYRDEQIFEAYYNWAAAPGLWISLDLQHLLNPAYNRDRGPVNLMALRLHAEY